MTLGFARCAPAIFARPLSKGFSGWIGLNHAKRGDFIEVNPVVGIRGHEIENAISVILREKLNPCVPPTISASLGYLMPEKSYRAWLFGGQDTEVRVAELVTAIGLYAIPFMESSASLDAVIKLLTNWQFSHRESTQYRLPIAYTLRGNEKKAAEACREYLDANGPRTDLAAIEYRGFCESLAMSMSELVKNRVSPER